MALLAYNLTAAPVTLTTVTPAITLPASVVPPTPGEGVNVTSELKGLSSGTYAALQTQALGVVSYVWSTGVAEYATPGLTVTETNQVISATTTIYVTTTGSDTTGTGSVSAPFLTIQKAIDYLKPFEIAAAVTIQVGVGTFDGFVLGRQKVVRAGPSSGSVSIKGTMIPAILSTGTASGTATSISTNVINDTGNNWTPNELLGKFYGTSATSVFPIVDNTSTSFTCIVSTSAGAYTIYEPGTIVVNNARQFASTPTGVACVVVGNNVENCGLYYMRFLTSGTSGAGYAIYISAALGSALALVSCEINLPITGNSTSGLYQTTICNGNTSISNCAFLLNKAASIGIVATASSVSAQYSYMRGGDKTQFGVLATNGGATYGTVGVFSCTAGNFFDNLKTVIGNSPFAPGVGSGALFGPLNWNLVGIYRNCETVCFAKGTISIGDMHTNQPSFPLASSGNTTFIFIDRNTVVQVTSNVPSGLATTDISVNGATSTLAAMRALTPRVFPAAPNAYGSYVCE